MDLTITNLTKKFDNFTAVDNINVTMTTGVYGLLGVNGAGKTTLMRMLCTLLRPTEGKITCNGKDILAMDGDYKKNFRVFTTRLWYLPRIYRKRLSALYFVNKGDKTDRRKKTSKRIGCKGWFAKSIQ